MALKSFSLSMIGIFIPIYLITIGFSIASVFVFFTILTLTHSLASIPAGYVASRYGYKHSILFSFPLLIIGFFLLYTLDVFHWPLFFVAFVFGFNNSLFWVGYHSDFSKFSHKKKRGSELGFAKIVTSLFKVMGPLVGGVILTLFGFKILFVIVSTIIFVAGIPLLLTKDSRESYSFSGKQFFSHKRVKDSISYLGFGFEYAAAGIVWPLFLFLFILAEQYTSLGLISSLSLFFSFLFIVFVSKVADKHRKLVLRISALGNAVVWVLRGFVKTTMQVFFVDSAYGLTKASSAISFDALSYDKANKEKIMSYIVYREFMINLGRAIFCAVMIFVSDLLFGVWAGGASSLLLLLF